MRASGSGFCIFKILRGQINRSVRDMISTLSRVAAAIFQLRSCGPSSGGRDSPRMFPNVQRLRQRRRDGRRSGRSSGTGVQLRETLSEISVKLVGGLLRRPPASVVSGLFVKTARFALSRSLEADPWRTSASSNGGAGGCWRTHLLRNMTGKATSSEGDGESSRGAEHK